MVGAAWLLQLRLLSRSSFFVWMALLTPLVYCSLAAMMAGGTATLRVVVGAGLMGAWSTTLFGAAEALFMQRFSGTLELLIGAPRTLIAPVLGFASATVTLGLYSLAASWLWATVVFNVTYAEADMVSVFGASISALVGLMAVGFFLSGLYVVTRSAMELSNVLEYPIWLVCGVLIPSTALWPPIAALGRVVPLGWATSALDRPLSAEWFADIGVSLALSGVYMVLGIVFLRRVDLLARRRGTLRLR